MDDYDAKTGINQWTGGRFFFLIWNFQSVFVVYDYKIISVQENFQMIYPQWSQGNTSLDVPALVIPLTCIIYVVISLLQINLPGNNGAWKDTQSRVHLRDCFSWSWKDLETRENYFKILQQMSLLTTNNFTLHYLHWTRRRNFWSIDFQRFTYTNRD